MLGTVTKYFKKHHGKKSYGFIAGYDGEEYYFNAKSLKGDIEEGCEVIFRRGLNNGGYYASNVTRNS